MESNNKTNNILLNENETLKTLIKFIYLIDLKDSYTKMHSENVSKYATILAKELNLEDEDVELIKIGALLHDIGKIGIPDYILTKKQPLTENEFSKIKNHTIIGEIILPNNGYEKIKQMIRSHHERIDGKGYPDGLSGSQIPYFARILSVVDSFDAMTTQRSYNTKKSFEQAFIELKKCSEKRINRYGELNQQLDPNLVNVFIKVLKNNPDLTEDIKKYNLSNN